MRKLWITVKCGLSRDPKHRQQMGECVWLFMHLIDLADWETGTIGEWKDEAGAEDMDMPLRTMRHNRKKLEKLGYITCVQRQHSQQIIIHNWTNPRDYSGQMVNEKQSGNKMSPSEKAVQGDIQGDIQGSSQNVTPTSSSKVQRSLTTTTLRGEIFKAYEANLGILTPMIADEVNTWIDDPGFPDQWIIDGIRRAVVQNKRSWAYVKAILDDWKAKGKQDTRPSKKESSYANKSGSTKGSGAAVQQSEYTDADRAAAERVRERKAARGVQ